MLFKVDNFADVLGIILGILLLVMSQLFLVRMRRNEATAWADVGIAIKAASAFFTAGMLFTLSTILFNDETIRELLNLVGNILWVIAAYFAYKMLNNLVRTLGVVMGV